MRTSWAFFIALLLSAGSAWAGPPEYVEDPFEDAVDRLDRQPGHSVRHVSHHTVRAPTAPVRNRIPCRIPTGLTFAR